MDKGAHDSTDIVFSPPLYRQRYLKALEILSAKKPKKVIDFGCAECKFLRLACQEIYVEELIGVDWDLNILKKSEGTLHPLIADYLKPRCRPLTLKIFQGSVFERDCRLVGCDAVVCLELIEHLHPANLKLFSKNIFGFLQISTVIVSTPNADFNCLFDLHGKLRHWDHKFEWTRSSFQKWCDIICIKYEYTVQYDGVGNPPSNSKHLGLCSQIAIFQRKRHLTIKKNRNTVKPYNLVGNIRYPTAPVLSFYIKTLTSKIIDFAQNLVKACFVQYAVPLDKFSTESLHEECIYHYFGAMSNFYFYGYTEETTPLSDLIKLYYKNASFLFQSCFSLKPCTTGTACLHVLGFCDRETSVPLLLFQKCLQFVCGHQDLLSLLTSEMVHGASIMDDQMVVIQNKWFCEDESDIFTMESDFPNEQCSQFASIEMSDEEWD